MRVAFLAVLAGLALALGGCGGGDDAATGGEGASSIAPASSVFYFTVNTDLDSDQVNQFEALLDKFPDKERLFDELRKELTQDDLDWERDVKPALGDSLDVVGMSFEEDAFVAILKPKDEAKLKALLAKGDDETVTREVEGWTVISDTAATIDRFEQASADGKLGDADAFKDAMDGLPDEALAKLYVNGDALTKVAEREAEIPRDTKNRFKAFAAALGAESTGLKLEGALNAELEEGFASLEPYQSKLIDAAPEDALVFLSGNGYQKLSGAVEGARDPQGMLEQFRSLVGVDLEAVARLFDREFALWVAPGSPFPEVTLLAETADEAAAKATLDALARRLQVLANAARRTTEVSGVQASQLLIEGFPITYATFDGRLIVTTRPGAIGDVRTGGGLKGSAAFSKAVDDAGMPDATFGFYYVNVQELVELIQGFASAAGESVPPEVQRNIDPLGSLLLFAEGKPEDLKLSAFLAIE